MALFIKPQTQLKLALNHNWLKPLKNNGKMETLTTLRMANVSERERIMCLFDRNWWGFLQQPKTYSWVVRHVINRDLCIKQMAQTVGSLQHRHTRFNFSVSLFLFLSRSFFLLRSRIIFYIISLFLLVPNSFVPIYLPFFLAPSHSLSTRSTHSFGSCVFVKLNWNWFLLNVYYSSFCLFVCPYLVGQRINFNVAAIKFCT